MTPGSRWLLLLALVVGLWGCVPLPNRAAAVAPQPEPDAYPLLDYLQAQRPGPAMVGYSPTNHDPRQGKTRRTPPARSLRADLESLRPAFDGLVLYGYDAEITPVVLAEARRLGFRAVLLGVWDVTSQAELAGTAQLVREYAGKLALGVSIGNEGICFNRYKARDLVGAARKLRAMIGPDAKVPFTTSEPLGEYGQATVQEFGDFLAPNIHPVFDQARLGPAHAATWTRGRAMALAEATGKPVLVKETGFPHGGRAGFTPQTQKQFWATYVRDGLLARSLKHRTAWVSHAVAFEAFDLPWKASQGKMPIEGAWGMMNVQRQAYPAFGVWKARAGRGG